MQSTEVQNRHFTPGSVPVSSQPKVYYSSDVEKVGGIESFLKSIGGDEAKQLPSIDFSEAEWEQMLKENA